MVPGKTSKKRSCIQATNHPIILTGAPALNKVLGREVYRSNNEIGGTRIMFGNGVTHLVVPDDFQVLLLCWVGLRPISLAVSS